MLSDLFYKLWNAGVIGTGVWETVYMTGLSTLAAYGIGLPLGIVLSVTDGGGLHPIGWLNRALGFVVNVFRSIRSSSSWWPCCPWPRPWWAPAWATRP